MRTLLKVEIIARKSVLVWVEHDVEEDATHLTKADRDRAFSGFENGGSHNMPVLEIGTVVELTPAEERLLQSLGVA